MIKDLYEKQLEIGFFLSRGKKNLEDKFTETAICEQWLQLWKEDDPAPVAEETKILLLNMYDKCDMDAHDNNGLNKAVGRANSNMFCEKMINLRHKHYSQLKKLLKEKGLDDKYYIKDQTAYKKHVTKLGRYALYNKGQTYKEASNKYGTYFEMKEIIEELTQEAAENVE